jgi:parvulin-like peptidyl-prolyl isomerase
MKNTLAAILALSALSVSAVDAESDTADAAPGKADTDDVIARVGDQTITFGEINVAINSSGIVGVSVPTLGSPDRDRARITLLDRFISANLLYLDARDQGVDKDPKYLRAVARFSDAMLAGLYRKKIQGGDIPVTEDEVQAYQRQHLDQDVEMTEDLHLQIEASLRRQKLHRRLAETLANLRDGVEVTVHPENLAVQGDSSRPDSTPMAEVGKETITWGDIGDRVIAAGKPTGPSDQLADPLSFEAQDQARRNVLEREVDLRVMRQKAMSAGLDQDPVYRRRVAEYQKTLLTNLHRQRLAAQMEPSDKELEAYYQANRNRFVVPEARKVQMVVVDTPEMAREVKAKLEAGELTMYVAARDYSTAVNAKRDLGEVGWLKRGEVVPALDEAIFALEPGKIGGPVETPAGWHLVSVLEVKDAEYTDFGDQKTRMRTRRTYLHAQLDAYTAKLRKIGSTVTIDQERLVQLAQQEANLVGALAKQAEAPGSTTHSRLRELQQLVMPRM